MKVFFGKLVVSLFIVLSFLVNPLISTQYAFAQTSLVSEEDSFSLVFNSTTNEFEFKINSPIGTTFNYTLIYEHDTTSGLLQEAIVGNVTADENGVKKTIYAGTCSTASCLPHKDIKSGELKLVKVENNQEYLFRFFMTNQNTAQLYSDVTVCKENLAGERLPGWEISLYPVNPLDTVKVYPTNTAKQDNLVASSIELLAGDYLVKVSGTYVYREDEQGIEYADAGFSMRLPSDDIYFGDNLPWVSMIDYPYPYINGYYPYPGYLSTVVNSQRIDWGMYNPEHIYSKTFNNFSGVMNFTIYDDNYLDNSGYLTAEIYRNMTGITGEDGCVTFHDVYEGKYNLDETMQAGWEFKAGDRGEVYVNTKTEQYLLVNDLIPEPTSTPSPTPTPSPSSNNQDDGSQTNDTTSSNQETQQGSSTVVANYNFDGSVLGLKDRIEVSSKSAVATDSGKAVGSVLGDTQESCSSYSNLILVLLTLGYLLALIVSGYLYRKNTKKKVLSSLVLAGATLIIHYFFINCDCFSANFLSLLCKYYLVVVTLLLGLQHTIFRSK